MASQETTETSFYQRHAASVGGENACVTDDSTLLVAQGHNGRIQSPNLSSLHPILRRLLVGWKFLVMAITPLVLIPLLVGSSEAKAAYVITVVAIYWVFEVAPLPATALLPAILFPLLGVLTGGEAASAYIADASMLFLGGLLIAVAVETWSLHERIALRCLLIIGDDSSWLMFGFMAITAFLSMWISNTASAAMMLPIAQAVLSELVRTKSRCDQAMGQNGDESSQASVDSPQESPSRTSKEESQLKKGMMLSVAYGANIGGIATLTGTGPNLVLTGQVDTIYPASGGVSFGQWFVVGLPTTILVLLIGWVWLTFLYDRKRMPLLRLMRRCLCWRQSYAVSQAQSGGSCCRHGNGEDDAVQVIIRRQYNALGRLRFAEIVVLVDFAIFILLLLLRAPGFMSGWGDLFKKDPCTHHGYVTDATTALFMGLILFLVPSHLPNHPAPAGHKRVLEWSTVNEKLPWGIFLLLGGGFCIAKGCEASNLSAWIGNQLASLKDLDVRLNMFIVTVIITFFTEIASNTASATVFLPILANLASNGLKVHPYWLMFPATMSCSFAYMLPAATPPNAIAFSYGHLRVIDMVKAGLVMNFIGILVVNFVSNTILVGVFNLNSFPSWANRTVLESACQNATT